ncbi:hypothetical protein KPL78_29675 [Roseomonas sp. HJA6]|uniref:Uncharacterized protein n=1 Tax=Roseomonas alba TaxID=2846776 RepID=A0ABS7AIP7_9PROT|nr:hypothetical protein [Neoroseomonas alba]MBW6402053.1 hypothetical protein [Neoroseomonas alba]
MRPLTAALIALTIASPAVAQPRSTASQGRLAAGLGIPMTAFPERFNGAAVALKLDVRAATRECDPPPTRPGSFRTCMFTIGHGLVAVASATGDHETLRSVEIFQEVARTDPAAGTADLLASTAVLYRLFEPGATPAQTRAASAALFGSSSPGFHETQLRETAFTRVVMPGVRITVSARVAGDND